MVSFADWIVARPASVPIQKRLILVLGERSTNYCFAGFGATNDVNNDVNEFVIWRAYEVEPIGTGPNPPAFLISDYRIQ